jgi:hypothetical protein
MGIWLAFAVWLRNILRIGRTRADGLSRWAKTVTSYPTRSFGSHDSQPASSGGFDSYRSVSDPNLMIIVAKEVVPPFRFKAGGWELFRPSIELGSAMKARIAEKGFFLIRVNQDQTGGTELTDLPLPLPSWE